METATRQDLREAVTDLKGYIGERVDRVETQVVQLNGRIQKHDRELADHAARMKALEDFKNNIVEFEVEDQQPSPVMEDDRPAFTKRDVKRLLALVTGLGAVIAATFKLIELGLLYFDVVTR